MFYALSFDCPIFHPENRLELGELIKGVRDGWHTVVFPTTADLRSLLPGDLFDFYGDLLEQSAKLAANSAHLYIPDRCGQCDPKALARLLGKEALIIVENPATDGAFILAVASILRPHLAARLSGPHKSAIIVHGAGIGEIPKEIERYVTEVRQGSYVAGLPRRIVAVSDSDAKYPGGRSPSARAVEAAAMKFDVECWVLQMRSIENYVPDQALDGYASVQRTAEPGVRHVVALTPPARDHYPIKDGLPEVEKRHLRELEIFGPSVPKGIGVGDFVKDLLTNHRHLVRREDLLQRDHKGDLNGLLDMIERML